MLQGIFKKSHNLDSTAQTANTGDSFTSNTLKIDIGKIYTVGFRVLTCFIASTIKYLLG